MPIWGPDRTPIDTTDPFDSKYAPNVFWRKTCARPRSSQRSPLQFRSEELSEVNDSLTTIPVKSPGQRASVAGAKLEGHLEQRYSGRLLSGSQRASARPLILNTVLVRTAVTG